jgi:NAD(P)-dependent dehydrogenase (short-subunit alcohol dehydrogenase family)
MSRRLDDHVVLITGSTSGIGKNMAQTFAREGAAVVITGRTKEKGEQVQAEIEAAGGQALFVPMDIEIEADVEHAVAEGVRRFGKLTDLVNNAAWVQGRWAVEGPVSEIALENWEKVVRVNLTGAFLASKYAVREIAKAGGGSVVHIASTAAMVGRPGLDAYTATKGALVSLTRSMAAYYSRYSIRVNCVIVGFIDTGEPAIATMLADPQLGPALLDYYMGKVGKPEDVSYLTAHLISDQAGFITGAILPVDGGATGTGHLDRQVADMEGIPSGKVTDLAAANRLAKAGVVDPQASS